MSSTVGTPSHDVAVGDLDGDSIPDIIVATPFDPGIRVLLGDGTGSFGPAAFVPVGTRGTVSVAVGRLDDDLALDAAVSTTEVLDDRRSVLATMVGDGAGGLVVGNVRPFSQTSGAILELTDIDEDGDLDVVAAPSVGGIDVYPGDGLGAFDGPSAHSDLSASDLAVADFDDDGWLDVAAAEPCEQILVLPGDGAGGLFAAVTVPTGLTNPYGIAAGDIDMDGRPDLVAALAGTDSIAVLRNAGDPPGHEPAPTAAPTPTPSPSPIATAAPVETGQPQLTPPATETLVSSSMASSDAVPATLAVLLVGLTCAILARGIRARRMP